MELKSITQKFHQTRSGNNIVVNTARKQYHSELWSKCTPVMVMSDKISLYFFVDLCDMNDREARVSGVSQYRVTVENTLKLNSK